MYVKEPTKRWIAVCEKTYRLKVPGGYIYRYTDHHNGPGGSINPTHTIVFVHVNPSETDDYAYR